MVRIYVLIALAFALSLFALILRTVDRSAANPPAAQVQPMLPNFASRPFGTLDGRQLSIVEIDGCEYLIWYGPSGYSITHKPRSSDVQPAKDQLVGLEP